MSWGAIVNQILAGSKRRRELAVESQSEYEQWISEIDSEIEVFVKRVNGLDLSESEDRDQFYDITEGLSDDLQELRERSESAAAPAELLIQLEELIEKTSETPTHIGATVAHLGNNPAEKARREIQEQKKHEKKEEKRTDEAREKRDAIAEEIQALTAAFEEDAS